LKAAVLSDIHSNLPALEAVLASVKLEGCEQTICLGDVVGYGAQPNECLELLTSEHIPILLGNHDAAVIGRLSLEYLNTYARQAAVWTMNRLALENIHRLALHPIIIEQTVITYVHSSPSEPDLWRYIFNPTEARAAFRAFKSQVCFYGHTHIPIIFTNPADDRRLINVGSVGQPRDRDPRACYGIYDTETAEFRWVRLDYDIDKTAKLIVDAGLPRFLADRLYEGI